MMLSVSNQMNAAIEKSNYIRVVRSGSRCVEKTLIGDVLPDWYFDDCYDRYFTKIESLLMERRKAAAFTVHAGDETICGSGDLLIAGLYSSHTVSQLIKRSHLRVVLNLRDRDSRRRFKVELHEGEIENECSTKLKSMFTNENGLSKVREKSYFTITDVTYFLSNIVERFEEIPIIPGIKAITCGEDIPKDCHFGLSEFIPIIPIAPKLEGIRELRPEFIVVHDRELGGAHLRQVKKIERNEGYFDFFRIEPKLPELRNSNWRSSFNVNEFPVFQKIDFCDYYEVPHSCRGLALSGLNKPE